jgi:hypothetical protein
MNTSMVVLKWLLPFFVIVLGFLLHNITWKRKIKFALYSVVIFSAFLCDLNKISFVNDAHDKIAGFAFMVIVFDCIFSFFKNKANKVRIVANSVVMLIYLVLHLNWIFSGPNKNQTYWNSGIVSIHDYTTDSMVLKEKKTKIRKFILSKRLRVRPFEKYVHSFAAPDGYYLAQFTYKWKQTAKGTMVDLYDDSTLIWTLGYPEY